MAKPVKMVIVEIGPRGRETPISWATGDHYAMQCATKIASTKPGEYYWREATTREVKALESQRGSGKLPGW